MNESRWFRFEICGDHNPSTKKLGVRYRTCRINFNGTLDQCQTFSHQYPNSSSVAALLSFNTSLEGFTSNVPCSGGTCGPNDPVRFSSHAMIAVVNHNPSFWIGPATEIEGGGGGGGVLAPPILLDD